MTDPLPLPDGAFVDVLASGVHDTKNTLFDALGRIDAVRRALLPGTDSEAAALLAEAHAAVERSADRLAHILSAYRLIRHENPVALLPTPLPDLAEYVRLRAASEWNGSAQLCVAAAPAELWIMDRELVADCLVNALLNGSRHADRRVTLELAIDDGWLQLRVADDGPGFPPGVLAGEEPTGSIGLFLAGKLAALHRRNGRCGRLELSNPAGGGAQFLMMLP